MPGVAGLAPPIAAASAAEASLPELAAAQAAGTATTPASTTPRSDAPPPAGYSLAILAISVNSETLDEPIVALRDEAGRVFVSLRDLGRWRVRAPAAGGVNYAGEVYVSLASIPGLVAKLDEPSQSLAITAAPELFESTAIDARGVRGPIPQRTATGGFLNYTLLASRVDTDTTTSGSFELGVFGPFGTVNSTAVASHVAGSTDFTRLDTTWAYAMPERLTTARAGDAISRGGAWGNALRFGGIQYATDFGTQPNLVLTPGQYAFGSAAVPSTVDVFVNNALVTQQAVRPGPFSITNIPPITGSGNVTLVVRDELGREQIITRPFYASQTLLRPGLTDFSIDAGWVRDNYGNRSNDYGSWIASGTVRRGFTDNFTAEARSEAMSGLANLGVAVSMLVGDIGVMSASAAGGHNPHGNGGRFALGFERQGRGLSFGVFGSWATPSFRLAGDIDPTFIIAHEYLASADYSFGRAGTVSFAYVDRTYRNQPANRIATLGYTLSLERWGSVAASVSRIRAADVKTTSVNVLWTMALESMTTASAGVSRVRGNDATGSGTRDDAFVGIQRNLPLGDGWGYRVRLSQESEQQAQLNYQNRFGTYSAEVARNLGQTGERVSASGGIGLISGYAFTSRSISDSFGLVRVPGYPGLRIYSDNREITRTNADGEAIVPRLLPYQRNSLRIDQADVPLDAEFDSLEREAVPFARSGVVVDFAVRPSRGALVTILDADGKPVPSGAQVRLAESAADAAPAFVALDGEAYVTGLSAKNRAVVTWSGKSCTIEFEFPKTTDPQPRLGPFRCVVTGGGQ